ncbi:hypothetical protein LSTR_LSTR014834 [Laodelphax striatellus]|uniref:Uncharacterized protein n=1 Tax=Laodelphax striatellus TaxID=195883 RepID=A0A482WJ30_LAOST|nr:hypothetical protein LSTR_LSTR008171 [Laodelphax striatellus]RZF34119.1 hypothetical protein LSTR_LSTR014834 [Laodelphax striatellus]
MSRKSSSCGWMQLASSAANEKKSATQPCLALAIKTYTPCTSWLPPHPFLSPSSPSSSSSSSSSSFPPHPTPPHPPSCQLFSCSVDTQHTLGGAALCRAHPIYAASATQLSLVARGS